MVSFSKYLLIASLLLTTIVRPAVSGAENISGKNLYGFGQFDVFKGSAPVGWKVDSWNQEFLMEKFGKHVPGRGNKGACLELKPGHGAAIIEFTGPAAKITASRSYLFKGYYASTCERLDVEGAWLDDKGAILKTFTIKLPNTQSHYTEFFDEFEAPAGAVAFRPLIRKKWQTGMAMFDDFTLREGALKDFTREFSLPPLKKGELRFPIFGWCTPGCWIDAIVYPLELYNSDKAFADYAMANFTVGSQAKFGTLRQGSPGVSDQQLVEDGKDAKVAWIHGGDEPGPAAFPALAQTHERIKKLAPNKPFLINLLPTYGFPSYSAYEDYISSYIRVVKPQTLTYDFYALGGANNGYSRDYFANCEIVRRHSLANSVDWGIIVGVTAFGGIRSPSEAEMRWQAFTSLAYGSKMLGWFTYLTEVEYGGMNWRDAAINWDGSRTHHYTMLRRINAEVLKLGNVLLRLKSTGVYHTKPLPELTRDVSRARLVKKISSGQWVLGEFSGGGKDYLVLSNRDYMKNQKASITLTKATPAVFVFNAATGRWTKSASYNRGSATLPVSIAKGDMLLIKLD